MKKRSLITWLTLAGLGYLVYKVLTQPSATGTISEQIQNLSEDIVNTVTPGAWAQSSQAQIYVPYINSVEAQNNIPPNLLARIAYEESHFRQDIVTGAVTSPAGAVGLMQLMPQYFPGAGQDWQADVNTAAALLVSLYKQFGDWQLAVAAYNDGAGNIRSILAGNKSMPAETRNYVSDIMADVPVSGSLVNV